MTSGSAFTQGESIKRIFELSCSIPEAVPKAQLWNPWKLRVEREGCVANAVEVPYVFS
jgi:hypothetical protein